MCTRCFYAVASPVSGRTDRQPSSPVPNACSAHTFVVRPAGAYLEVVLRYWLTRLAIRDRDSRTAWSRNCSAD